MRWSGTPGRVTCRRRACSRGLGSIPDSRATHGAGGMVAGTRGAFWLPPAGSSPTMAHAVVDAGDPGPPRRAGGRFPGGGTADAQAFSPLREEALPDAARLRRTLTTSWPDGLFDPAWRACSPSRLPVSPFPRRSRRCLCHHRGDVPAGGWRLRFLRGPFSRSHCRCGDVARSSPVGIVEPPRVVSWALREPPPGSQPDA